MHKFKLISFDMIDSLENLGLPELDSLRERVAANEPKDRNALIRDIRLYGAAMSVPVLEGLLQRGNVESILRALTRTDGIEIPEMIDIAGMPHKAIMKNELTVGQFKQFVEDTGYEIEGHNAQKLKDLLDGDSSNDALVSVSLLDARAYAEWLSEKTGRRFRVQTDEEWMAARDELSGSKWTWIEAKYGDETFVLRMGNNRTGNAPESRSNAVAVRLVEDT